VALFIGIAATALSQTPLSIRGTVVDATGAVVPGLVVTLDTRSGTPVARTGSDANGTFVFTGLSAGDLVLSVPAVAGLAARTIPVHLTANLAALRVGLTVASVSQEVRVGSQPTLSTDSSANRDTITVSGDDLRKLPAFDLDYTSALSSFLDPSSASSGGVTLIVDGIEMKSVGVSSSAIQEVRINNDPYSAEFSRPGRGRIEVTTKPGSPD
jgi:hypothetical protein